MGNTLALLIGMVNRDYGHRGQGNSENKNEREIFKQKNNKTKVPIQEINKIKTTPLGQISINIFNSRKLIFIH